MKMGIPNTYLVSVVVPIFNADRHLITCVESLIRQTYKNLEIILVDDGSTDNSPRLCDELAARDQRIRVIHQANSGAARARNVAIAQAKGEYLALIDSDDYIQIDYIEKLVHAMVRSDADISVCGFTHLYSDGTKVEHSLFDVDETVITGRDAIVDFLYEDSRLYHVFWNKLYKTSLFRENGISIPDGGIFEDSRTLYKLYRYATRVACINDLLYTYIHREGSLMNRKFDRRNLELLNFIPREASNWLNRNDKSSYKWAVFSFVISGCINSINYCVDRDVYDKQAWLKSRRMIIRRLPVLLLRRDITTRRKITCILVVLGYRVYVSVRKRYLSKKGLI